MAISPDPLLATMLAGSYLIRERIGSGGMGTVYKAEQVALGRNVAIKLVHPALLTDPSVLSRFEAEAQTASRLNHPNTISIFDYGRAPDGRPFLVMEYVRGTDLAELLGREPILPRPRVCRIVLGLLRALEEAHEHEIIHRDLKPENIILSTRRDGVEVVKVADFGLAQVIGRRRATQPGVLVGTPGYMSPEQIADEPLDGRSDLYAVGVLLHELLTGQPVFAGKSMTTVMFRQLQAAIPDPREVAPRLVPHALAEIAMRALERRPEARYPNARAMADALESAARRLQGRNTWPDAAMSPSDVYELSGEGDLDDALARLSPDDRVLLQAAAVLGAHATLEAVGAVAGGPDPARLAQLTAVGLVRRVAEDRVELDAAVREMVEASVPALAARELHDRALVWHAHQGSPLAVRTEHACCGSDPLVALVLLEMLARDLRDRHCNPTRVLWRGLEMARRAFSSTAEEHYLTAVLEFTRHLADTLSHEGRHSEVRGLLREALDLAPPTSTRRRPLERRLRELEITRHGAGAARPAAAGEPFSR